MTTEIELPPARASRAHRAAVLNEQYREAVASGEGVIAVPVDGDAWAAYANRSMLTRHEYRDLLTNPAYVLDHLEPTC